jgi:hypothetical protein
MNLVIENIFQGEINGLEYILLMFHSQISYDNFLITKEPSDIWEDYLHGNFVIETLYFEETCLI